MKKPTSAKPNPFATGHTPSGSRMSRRGIGRREVLMSFAALSGASLAGWSMLAPERALGSSRPVPAFTPEAADWVLRQAVERVLPSSGVESRIALKDSVLKLIDHGIVERDKFLASLAQPRTEHTTGAVKVLGASLNQTLLKQKEFVFAGPSTDSIAPEVEYLLRWPSNRPIHLTRENAGYYVNLLWPIGLANRMAANAHSPINGESLPTFASTAGWTLGKDDEGSRYFNKFAIVDLSPEQEELVLRVANSTYRPCCNNSTFFQDCNHGSALLGLLQLGASQGLSEQELYSEALLFNSFWFPAQYVQTALYFDVVENVGWTDVDPVKVMSFNFSALGPWQQNVGEQLAKIPNLIPNQGSGANCGV